MKPADFFSALLTFFNDFIGMAAPGFILLIGVVLTQTPAETLWQSVSTDSSGSLWLIGIVLSYAIGHVLLSVHRSVLSFLRRFTFLDFSHEDSEAYQAFRKVVSKNLKKSGVKNNSLSSGDIRSLAMSVSTEAAELGRRFMFIALFCNGVATGLCLLLLASFAGSASAIGTNWATRSALLVVAALLFWRGRQFESRALSVPFPVALSAILFGEESAAEEDS